MLNRRRLLKLTGAAALTAFMPSFIRASPNHAGGAFRFCLNTSTIRGQNMGLLKSLEIASAAGYDGVELWVSDIRDYLKKGNKVDTLAKFIADHNLTVEDAISFQYQTEKWNKPAKLLIEKLNEENDIVTIQAKLLDDKNVQCLDSANWIRFGLAGDGELIDNQGTSSGARYVQLYNGRAVIKVKTKNGKSVVSAKVDTVPTAFINL